MMKFSLSQIHDRIFLLTFDDSYDIGMHFLRAQEYYESNCPKFYRKEFRLLDYIEWYSKNNDSQFTYAYDFTGFNVPGNIMNKIYTEFAWDDYFNKYDSVMANVVATIHSLIGKTTDYYLIGAQADDSESIDHEIAHALWHISLEYQTQQLENIDKIDNLVISKIKDCLRSEKYSEDVIYDEVQAYLSTGLDDSLAEIIGKGEKKLTREFISTFKKYKESIIGK